MVAGMAKPKRLKLKRERHARVAPSDALSEARALRESREAMALVQRLKKVGGAWRYTKELETPEEDAPPSMKGEEEEAALEEEEDDDDISLDVAAGAMVAPAFDHPELQPFIRMAQAGIDAKKVERLMLKMGLDATVLENPDKPVVVEAQFVKELTQIKKALVPEEQEENTEDSEDIKVRSLRDVEKHDPTVSLQCRQLTLLRMADLVCKFQTHFKIYKWKLGNNEIGFAIDESNFALLRGVETVLGEDFYEEEEQQRPILKRDESGSTIFGGGDGEEDIAEEKEPILETTHFAHGSTVYKAERAIFFLQTLGYVASLDVDWPPKARKLMNWTSFFLEGHLWPMTTLFRVFQKDLYFYRDVIKFLYSMALGPALLAALFYLWEIRDYTDPKITDRWLFLHIQKWYTRGLPRSFLYVLLSSAIFIPSTIATGKHATIVVAMTFAAYAWLFYVFCATAWRSHFRSKIVHNKSYTSLAVLKETIKAKNTLCFVVLFLTYMPTCLSVLGGLLPIHSVKVWDRHRDPDVSSSSKTRTSATEPVDYYHVPCYFLSFPPRVKPRSARSRKSRMNPPGFASYAPHAYHPHSATNRIDCSQPLGVLLYAASSVFVCLYLLGLPLIIYHLTKTATSQLHHCDWWQNYQTAYRRFGNVMADCEHFHLEEVVTVTAKLFAHGFEKQIIGYIKKIGQCLQASRSFVFGIFYFFSSFVTLLSERLAGLCAKKDEHSLLLAAKKKKQQRRQKLLSVSSHRGMMSHSSSRGANMVWASGGHLDNASEDENASISSKKKRFWCWPLRKKMASFSSSKSLGVAMSLGLATTGKRKKFLAPRDPRDDAPTRGLRLVLYKLMEKKAFHGVITVAVLVSLGPIIWEKYLTQLLGKLVLKVVVIWICGLIFFFECALKLIALKPKVYFQSKLNVLDFCLVLLWLMEVFLNSGTNLNFLRSLRALKSARMLRMARMARTLRVLKIGKQLEPCLLLLKQWVLRWVADTPPNNALLEKMERAEQVGKWRINKSLAAKIEKAKVAFLNAKREYVITFEEFTRDHELVIEENDVVVDTSSLGYLIWPFKANASFWRVVLILEVFVFSTIGIWLRASRMPWVQCLGLAVTRSFFGFWTTLKRPYMYDHEKQLDESTRTTIICLLFIGMIIDLLPTKSSRGTIRGAFDFLLVVIILQSALRVLYFLRVHDAMKDCLSCVMRSLDASVLALISDSLDVKSYALENSNLGLLLIQQWDDLLERSILWPCPRPRNLLTFRQKLLHMRWARLRNMRVAEFRTPTGQCILHVAMLKGEPEAVKWILQHHPTLLDVADDQRDSPVILALKELAKTLLKHNETPTPESSWKRAKFAEILLSDQIQHYRVPWSLPHFRSLGDSAVPLYGELVQQLAFALNLRPPAGFVRISQWMHYPGDIPDFLGQCFLACRDVVDAPRSELGDVGARTFRALLGALAQSQTSITISSNFFSFYPIFIVRFIASGNRLKDDSLHIVAKALESNSSLTYLDLRRNHFTDRSGPLLAQALSQHKSLTMVTLAKNRFGSETGEAFAEVIRENDTLKSLNLSANCLGPKLFWRNRFEKVFVSSSGPSLCEALRYNSCLTCLNLSDNGLGAESALALARACRLNAQKSRLLNLGFSGNDLGVRGGKALAHALKHANLTRLDASNSGFGAAAGMAFCAALKKNTKVVDLDLSQNLLGSKAGVALALALKENGTLTALRCDDNAFGPSVLRAFADTVEKCPTLTTLTFAKNALSQSSFEGGQVKGLGKVVARALKRNPSLTHLDLASSDFPPEELLAMVEGLGDSKSLIRVSLEGQHFNNAAVLQLTNALDRARRRRAKKTRPLSPGTKALLTVADEKVGEGLAFVGLKDCAMGGRAGPVAVGALASLKKIRSLSLGGNHMGSKLGDHLASHLASDACVLEMLDISRNDLAKTDTKGALLLAQAFEKNTTLTDIDLSENHLPSVMGRALADAFCEIVESGSVARPAHVKRLILAKNFIGTKAAADICLALRLPCTEILDLSENDIGSEAGKTIGQCLRVPTIQWQVLKLDGNALGKEGANAIFWALRRNASLKLLSLSKNGLGPDFGTERDLVEAYGNSLASAVEHNFSLESLNLAQNDMSFDCGICLCEALRENPSLHTLNFEGNAFDATAAAAVASKLEDDQQLTWLSLRQNALGWEGGFAIAEALCLNNNVLLSLDLSYNHLGDGGPVCGRAIADMIAQNTTLLALLLEGCFLGPKAGNNIASAITKNNTLRTLVLNDNHFDHTVGRLFLSNLADNTALRNLSLSKEEVGTDINKDLHALITARIHN